MPYLTGPGNPFSRPPLATNTEREMDASRQGASRSLIPPPPHPPSPLNAYRSPAVRGIGTRATRTSPTGGRRRTRRRHPKKRTRKNKKKHF